MKTEITIKKEVDIRFLKAEMAVRYGQDDIPSDFPFREGDMWIGTIDIDEGRILSWPAGKVGPLAMKVCDCGTYTLYDAEWSEIAKLENDYVPNNLLPGEYGDYVNLEIDETGRILNWPRHPSFEDFFSGKDD